MTKTIFEKIIDRELPADIVFENDQVIAIKDKYPQAPIHLLIIAKKVIPDIQSLEDYDLLKEMVQTAKKLTVEFGIEDGYRLLTNNGPTAGQSIFHLHFHLLGGKELGALG